MSLILKGQSRETTSNGVNTQLRKDGYIPAIIYGKGIQNIAISVYSKDLIYVMNNGLNSTLIDLEVDSQKHSVIVKEIQTNKITGKTVHVDFQKVFSDQPIFKEVPIHLVGEQAAKKAGIIQFQKREIEVRGLPHEIPHHIDLDIGALTAGTTVSVGEVPVSSNLEIYSPKEEVVLSLMSVSYAEEVDETAETPVAEIS
ncbi:50S ribosomal protein L25 [Alkalicella caledoniensis]|uniref:Large ribosomal subunit protein bL25 n=1 Tax=Alkalicella caledoniensis TaxID=2731377 RepID=A0A7G9W863_ALKCA|nr:50S ribosomal protein L25 [Alkalicella caledoniensis]QNO14875.1 50S ribosomal protein L25 [Alkalicella caledoniensis]